jgi:hypothetical protein
MNTATYLFEFNWQNILANLLIEGLRGRQRAKIAVLSKPEPRSESIVASAKNFRPACSKGPQLPIRACALQDECRLGLVELASYAQHMLIAQPVRALHYRERVSRQGSIGKDIDQARNEFDHFPPMT